MGFKPKDHQDAAQEAYRAARGRKEDVGFKPKDHQDAAQEAYRAARGRKEDVGFKRKDHCATVGTSAQSDGSTTAELKRRHSAAGQPALKHSRAGIASFALAGLVLICMFMLLAFAAALQMSGHATPRANSIAVMGVIFIWPLALIAVILGIVGVVNRNSKKVFSVVGLVIGGLILVLSVPVVIASNNSKSPTLPSGPKLPPNTSLRLSSVSVGNSVDSAGRLQESNFRRPKTSIVGYISFANAAIDSDTIVFALLSPRGSRHLCNPQINSASGNVWCKWSDVGVGTYKVELRINQTVVQEIPVHVT